MLQRLLQRQRLDQGFTLIEVLVVMIMVGVLAAIAAPGWFQYVQRRRLVAAQTEFDSALQQASTNAKQRSASWDFGARDNNGVVEWAIYSTSLPSPGADANWQAINDTVQLDHSHTTLASSAGIYSARFTYKGHSNKLGRFTLQSTSVSEMRECIWLSTLLGETRLEGDEDCL